MPRVQRGQRGRGAVGPLTRAAARAQGVLAPVVAGRGHGRGGRGVVRGAAVQPQRGQGRGRGRPVRRGVVAVAPPLQPVVQRGRRPARNNVGRGRQVRGRGRARPPPVVLPAQDDDELYDYDNDFDNDYNDDEWQEGENVGVANADLDPAGEFEDQAELQDQINGLQARLTAAQRRGRVPARRGRGGWGQRGIGGRQAVLQDPLEEEWEAINEEEVAAPGRGTKRRKVEVLMGPAKPATLLGEPEPVLIDKNGARQALKDLLGVNTDYTKGEVLANIYLDGFTVDFKTKQKIWLGAYVLAPKLNLPNNMQSRYIPGIDSHLTFPSARPRIAANFDEWLTWFSVYASIYVKRFLGAASGMFSYQNRIYELYKDESNTYVWRHYDELFRHAKALCVTLPWEICNPELLHKARLLDTQVALSYRKMREGRGGNRGRGRGRGVVAAAAGSATSTRGSRAGGTCNRFNDGKACPYPQCIFAHVCGTCKGSHPQVYCKQSAASAAPHSAPTSK